MKGRAALLIAGGFVLIAGTLAGPMLLMVDARDYYLPAARVLLQGGNPYTVEGFYNPPWALLPFLPAAILPNEDAAVGLSFAMLLVCMLSVPPAMKWGWVRWGLFMLFPPTLCSIAYGNVEALVLVGAVLPGAWGLPLLLVKPQVGLPLFLYRVWEAWKQRRLLATVRPTAALLTLSTLAYGPWPLHMLGAPGSHTLNTSLWPQGIVLGALLLAGAFLKKDWVLALGAGPFLSPYVLPYSWVGLWVCFLEKAESSHLAPGAALSKKTTSVSTVYDRTEEPVKEAV